MVFSEIVANVLATAILTALAFVPLVNIWVGTIVGASFGGLLGFFAGALSALLITALEMAILRWMEQGTLAAEERARELVQERQRTIAMQSTAVARLRHAIVSLSDWKQQRKTVPARRVAGSAVPQRRVRRRVAA